MSGVLAPGKDAPQISVITPTFNRLDLLRETIASVQAQHFAAWEMIVVDDGSSDGTQEALAGIAKADPRIRFVQCEGAAKGGNVCRNLGLGAARSDLIVFLDSDDVLLPHCLGGRVAMMGRNQDLDFAVYPAGIFFKQPGDCDLAYHAMRPGDDLLRFLSHECVWEITGPVWRSCFLAGIGGFDESLKSMQDLDLHVRAIVAGGRYLFVCDTDHMIRGHDDPGRTSMRHFRDPEMYRSSEALRAKLAALVSQAGLMTWTRRRAMLGLSFSASELWAGAGGLANALASWSRGCALHKASLGLRLEGAALLVLTALRLPTRRLIGRWSGARRLRPEPVPIELLD